ncbi:single-stranded DNA-binding protein [Deinococcus sp. HMF7620]|uniref:Single-stranded DNA-binding protein n=1 Tax=Deinococcus arboris TaxID=2682977 RepID=A0A7C9HU13_9DEIO|nr:MULTISPECIES: single-stranded DNA-binding protein [Deinococcus]MBZ9752577.1 single-stranded DNA-binding protein [Deinococcus betulae]MVN88994.1 single-stranded DNA-binding protein [Deinococcus arboris]
MAEPSRVRDALRASMTAWATLSVRGDQARVTLTPDLAVLSAQLDAIDPGWSLTWACDHVTPPIVRARLGVLGATREGLATGHTLADAKLAALADLARSYGVQPSSEAVWVEYDPEDGANTAELEAETPAPQAPASRPLPKEPPRDPQMDKARRHIEDLLEQLKVAGRGGDAARILMRGYGETLDESRAIYKELQTLLKG